MLSIIDVQLVPGDPGSVATIAALPEDPETDTPATVTLTADGPMTQEGYRRLLLELDRAARAAWCDWRTTNPGPNGPEGPLPNRLLCGGTRATSP